MIIFEPFRVNHYLNPHGADSTCRRTGTSQFSQEEDEIDAACQSSPPDRAVDRCVCFAPQLDRSTCAFQLSVAYGQDDRYLE